MSNFPEWYTIDDEELDALSYSLFEEFKDKTVKDIREIKKKIVTTESIKPLIDKIGKA